MTHSVLAIANEFIERARRQERALTPMQLQKLCYISHGYRLALAHVPLIRDVVEAWDYGPVYPELYQALKRYGSRPVSDLICENNWAVLDHVRGQPVKEILSEDERGLLDGVFDAFGRLEAFRLSNLTHADGSPWAQTYRPNVTSIPIQNGLIERYFRDLTERPGA
jgi:uncharacterized phage-associated protein